MNENRNGFDSDNPNNSFPQLFFRYLKYWPLFLVLFVLCCGLAVTYLKWAIPVYEVTGKILIKDERKGTDESKVLEALNMLESKKIIENEIEVLHSRSVLKEVVSNLHLTTPLFHKGSWARKIPAYLSSPIRVEAKAANELEEQDKLIDFSYEPAKQTVTVGNREYSLNTWHAFPFGTIRFVRNPFYKQSKHVQPLSFAVLNEKEVVKKLSNQLQIDPASKSSTVINLKLKDEVPQRGEDILNAVITVYNNTSIEGKQKLAVNTLAFIEDRLRYVVSELDSVENVIQRYKVNKGIVDMSEQGKIFLASVGTNDQKVSDINMQLAILNQVESYVVSNNEDPGISPSTVGLQDGMLSQLLQKLNDLVIQREKLKRTTAENNPIILSIQAQIDKIKPTILQNIQNQRSNLQAGKNDLATTTSKYSSMLRTIPQKEKELLEIGRQQAIKNYIYTFLLQKREETAIAYASTVPGSRSIDQAESSADPVSPKKLLVFLLAAIIALTIGAVIVACREVFNQNILYRSEIEDGVAVPIIGEISHESKKRNLVIGDGEKTFIAEQFRQLRASLAYLSIDKTRNKLLITSSIGGEGKSFIAANLGMSLALSGKKTVIVDLDLRKPQLSRIFDHTESTGITHFLIDNATPFDIIHSSAENENLFIVPAGPVPPNPTELLLNGRIDKLLTYLNEHFDYILIDTAPINPVADAQILSKYCDATIYVIRHGYTPRAQLKLLDQKNKVRGLKNTAIVFNDVKTTGLSKIGYGYGYDYKSREPLNGTAKSKRKLEAEN
ncbi:MAG TPA: polysaccharide biosynthesis tyrosine autokinase [Flavitalea sp.]|nr:polysaccharide biosynthesis tyrosine autokinase [Flavitalea sp.]